MAVHFVIAGTGKPAAGAADSMLLPVPGRWYTQGEDRVLIAPVMHADLRQLCEAAAAKLGERLHHADWILTTDPGQVAAIGRTHPGCADCERGTAAALAYLEQIPDAEIACGMLYWAA